MSETAGQTAPPRRGPGWAVVLLLLAAGALMIAGIAFPKLGWLDSPVVQPGAGQGVAPATLAGDQPAEPPAPLDRWGPTLFRLGFSFVVGFIAGFFLRTLMGVTLIALVVAAAALYGLEYAGLVDVHWTAFESKYDSVAAWAAGQFSSLRAFVTGAVPSVTLAAVGLFLGWRR